MAKLALTLNGKVIDQYFIDKPATTIGRDAENDIVIDDSLLSRVHARITRLGEDDIIEDLKSRNGTRINGRPLDRHILQHRDVIEIGKHQLRYMSSRMASDAELDRTMIIQNPAQLAGGTAEKAADAPVINIPLAQSARPRLASGGVTVLADAHTNRVGDDVHLDRVVTTFGIPGKDLFVLTRRPHGIFLTQVEGAQFPRVNGRTIDASAYTLKDGDQIEAAGYQLEFKAEPTADR